ncbi:hypothetical protein QBC42DRAFT_96968 [Cladorrhinum samala]|uniref:Succinate dehydrogenase subunit 4 n=1 Tax=Cladorrhinum samala TaxID=585594 RepID=A0AAV9HYZ2_9PEZI|nr:hypothetical protein QBC42DRAFT_96968 [Cladorrhinum samala]
MTATILLGFLFFSFSLFPFFFSPLFSFFVFFTNGRKANIINGSRTSIIQRALVFYRRYFLWHLIMIFFFHSVLGFTDFIWKVMIMGFFSFLFFFSGGVKELDILE